MTENKRYKYYEEENGEFPFPSIKTDDGKTIVSLYECYDLLNEQEEEIQRLKDELFESRKDYIIETYSDNPVRRDMKIQSLKEEFKERFGD